MPSKPTFYHLLKTIFFICFLWGYTTLNAQQCDWLEVGTSQSGQYSMAIATDLNNDVVITGYFADSFSIGTHFIPKSTNSSFSTYIIKYDNNGVIKWINTVQHTSIGFGWQACRPATIATDDSNNVYVAGYFIGNLDFGNSVLLSSTAYLNVMYLVKYNSSGVAQWAIKTGGTATAIPSKIVIDNPGNVFLSFSFTNTVSFQGTTKTISTTTSSGADTDYGIVKYTSAGNFVNAAGYGGSSIETPYGMGVDDNSNIFLIGGSFGSFTFAGQQLVDTGEVILKIDSALQPIKGKKTALKEPHSLNVGGIAVQANGKFAVVSNFFDSVNFGNNVWLKSPWSNFTISGNPSLAIVFYDSSLTPIWARTNSAVSSAQPSLRAQGGVFIKNENIYFGGTISANSTRMGSSTIAYVAGGQKFFITKMDTLGNFLWAFANNDVGATSELAGCEVDNLGNAFITGTYYSKVSVFAQSKNGNPYNGSADFFTAKISDYTITRGPVSSGPYCAGDTLKIPYTITGIYNTGNEFIAELSDSAGNFNGDQRELGRLRDTLAGTINGSLPLFNVATTNKYRIRIISTNPVVQSYYKYDLLRLLIYSRDTANAGPDFYACYGQAVHLGTTGGSKWLWSPPQYFINPADSTNRQPLIKLYDSAEFRIIISDSSGCGNTDTDFVKVYVRPPLKATIQGNSIICKGYRQKLVAKVTGGDSTQYWHQWKIVGINSIQSKSTAWLVGPVNNTDYMLIVGDSCSEKIDTAYFTIKVVNDLKAIPSADTTICKGKSAQLSVVGAGCNPTYYKYEWVLNGNVLSNNDSLLVNPASTTQYSIILSDTTTLLSDTAIITVTVDSVFNVTTLPDTTICIGQNIDLKAFVFSCDTSNMIYTWDNGLGTGNSHTISPTTTTTYRVIGENTFNGLKDTATVKVTVRAPLKVTVNADTTICIGEPAELRATTTGGRTSTHQILWTADNGPWTSAIPSTTATPTTTTKYKVVLTDGCTPISDSAFITITVRPPLKVSVNSDTTICVGEAAELRAVVSGGNVPTHQLLWMANNQQLSTTLITTVTPTTTTTYTATLTDNCTVNGDSAKIVITVRPPLKVLVNPDTTICVGETAELRAVVSGGNVATHSLLWTADSGPWTSANLSEMVNPTTTTTYKALLNDNCTLINDSATITVTVRPPLSVSGVAKDSICSNQVLLLSATPSGGYLPNHQILWTVDGGPWTSAQNPATDTPKINTKYIVKLSDNCSPDVFDTLEVVVLPAPVANFVVAPVQGCPPLTVSLTDVSVGNDSLRNGWTVHGVEYDGVGSVGHEFTKPGYYDIGLNVSNVLGCADYKIQRGAVTVFDKPVAGFTVKPDIKEVDELVQLYNNSRNATNVIWDMGDGQQLRPKGRGDTTYLYGINDTGDYPLSLIAQNNQGCYDTATLTIHLFDKVFCAIPSGFTPNGDGLNDVFAPVCNGVAFYTLTIYNRWGQVILECENCTWDGTYAGTVLSQDVYIYKLQIQADSHKKKLTYGTVQIVR
jgi:gliding motility-associated-like protein